jgi:hypothetical protein
MLLRHSEARLLILKVNYILKLYADVRINYAFYITCKTS